MTTYRGLGTSSIGTPKIDEIVSVKEFGARGDGVTDDTTSIQNALDSGKGIIYMQEGTYLVSSALVVKSNTKLIGYGVGQTIIKPYLSTGHSHHLIANYAATQTSGTTLDTNIEISGMTLDGRSTDPAVDDGRRGYGIEIYGLDTGHIHDIKVKDMPLSGIEVCGDYAAIAYGVRSGTAPLKCIDVIVENIELENVGFQEDNLTNFVDGDPSPTEREEIWGDAGFGVIARAPARNVTLRNITGRGVQFGIAGVGQISNKNDSAKTGDNLAQVIDARIESCFADQSGYTPLAPAFRAAFCRNVTISNCIAANATGTQGISCRQAGTTWVQNVSIVGCHAHDCDYGLIASGAGSSDYVEGVQVIGGTYYGNDNDGIYVEDLAVSVSGALVYENDRNGINVEGTANGTLHTVLSGCISKNNGQSVTGYGIRLDDCERVVVSGCQAFDDAVSPTQNSGVRETGSSDYNTITGCIAYGNTAANNQIVVIGTNSEAAANSPSTASTLEASTTIASGAIDAPSIRYNLLTVDTEASAATDDIDTINGSILGQVITLKAADSSRTVVVKDNTGNINLNGDFSLTNINDTITLIYRDPGQWSELSRSDNAA